MCTRDSTNQLNFQSASTIWRVNRLVRKGVTGSTDHISQPPMTSVGGSRTIGVHSSTFQQPRILSLDNWHSQFPTLGIKG